MQNIVSEHEQYLDAVRDFNDWLISAKEELQRWSDLSGDSVNIKRKLSKVQVRKILNGEPQEKVVCGFLMKDVHLVCFCNVSLATDSRAVIVP